MKKLLIILAMIFIGCSESGNSVAVLEFDPTDVENDSTEIDSIEIDSIVTIDTIDTIDSVKETKDTIINTKKNKEESSNSNEVTSSSSTKKDTVVVSSSSKVEDKSSSSINVKKEESSSSMEKKNESSSSEKVVLSSSSSSSEKLVESSSSELIVSSSSEKKVESSSSSKIVESSSSEKIVNSSSSDNDDYIDKFEPKSTIPYYVELDELKLNGFRVENNIAYLSWENNTNFTMQINVEYYISCVNEDADSTIMYTIKANSVKEKAIYEIKNNEKHCAGYVKSITATENDKSNFAGWVMGSDRGLEDIIFRN
jgi:hypothetical protein